MKQEILAWWDLLSGYAQRFKHVWRIRRELDGTPLRAHEAEFLPAALALQETPVSPAPRIAMWAIIGFAAIALLWACFGKVDVVANAQGKVVPNDRTKLIQAFETARVKAIYVSDGKVVKAGDVLIELDATDAQADDTRIAVELVAAKAQVARAQAMLAALTSGREPQLGATLASNALAQEAERLLQGQYSEYIASKSRLDADAAQRSAEMNSVRAQIAKLEQTVPIARKRAEDFKGLVDKNFVSKHGYLEREQARIEQEADLAAQRSHLQEIAAQLQQAQAQKNQLLAQTRRTNLDSLNEGLQKVAALEQEHIKANARGKSMRLTAPVDGTVQQLAVHTLGGVVTPAQSLLVIVPRDQPLEVEAFIDNKDIGFIRPQQEAEVKVETFQFTKYGSLSAKVSSVSHDAINDEKRGLIYSARVKLQRTSVNVDGVDVNLSPGMAVNVEIKTGQRRVIEYFLSPLLQHTSESLHER